MRSRGKHSELHMKPRSVNNLVWVSVLAGSAVAVSLVAVTWGSGHAGLSVAGSAEKEKIPSTAQVSDVQLPKLMVSDNHTNSTIAVERAPGHSPQQNYIPGRMPRASVADLSRGPVRSSSTRSGPAGPVVDGAPGSSSFSVPTTAIPTELAASAVTPTTAGPAGLVPPTTGLQATAAATAAVTTSAPPASGGPTTSSAGQRTTGSRAAVTGNGAQAEHSDKATGAGPSSRALLGPPPAEASVPHPASNSLPVLVPEPTTVGQQTAPGARAGAPVVSGYAASIARQSRPTSPPTTVISQPSAARLNPMSLLPHPAAKAKGSHKKATHKKSSSKKSSRKKSTAARSKRASKAKPQAGRRGSGGRSAKLGKRAPRLVKVLGTTTTTTLANAGTATSTTTAAETATTAPAAEPTPTAPAENPTTTPVVAGRSPTSVPATGTTQPPASPTTAAATPTTSQPPPAGSGAQTPASLWPSSIFDSNVEGWAVDPNSSEFVNDFVSDYQTHYGSVGVNTMPIYSVPAGAPDASVSVRSGCNNFLPSTGSEIPVPSYAALNGSSDDPLIVYQPSTLSDWELWEVDKQSDTSYSACWGGKLAMGSSDGVFPPTFGLSATGISYLATTVTEADVESGTIGHAIAVILPGCNGYTYPADRGDCGSDGGQPAEGQWYRFPAGLAMPSGLNPFAQMVFRAIQAHGMVVVDQGGSVSIEAEQSSDWAAEGNSGTDPITASWDGLQEYQVVQALPWSDLQVVDPPQ